MSLHPEKTRLIEFGRYAAANRERRGARQAGDASTSLVSRTSARQIATGGFLLKRKTRRDRMRAKLQEIKEELAAAHAADRSGQGKWLRQVVRGWFAYHAVPTNRDALAAFRHPHPRAWRRALRRRGQRDRIDMGTHEELADSWLPQPRILHPWPEQALPRQTPKVGARCVNYRTPGSVRGALSNERSYRDRSRRP